MKSRLLALMLLLTSICVSTSQADIIFSRSGTDALAGNSVEVQVGQSSSIFVWVSTAPAQTMTGISFNVLSSVPATASGVSHTVQNGGRWSSVQAGGLNTSGNLLNNHRAFYLPGITAGTGINTGGLNNYVLHSQLQFTANAIGTTNLTFTSTTAGISFLGVGGNQWNNVVKGVGSINVSAVPEPSSALLVLVGAAGWVVARRRRV
ncbi:MAG: PEP-CTERM sorting domain-containing protein [Planctomycetaceae bacterium]|nr:PEP-CTERM sorting domain-containing protein [Planctomycetaceae bacterium]